MPIAIRCPTCGFAGESRDPEEVFQIWGKGAEDQYGRSRPVPPWDRGLPPTIRGRPAKQARECKVCGARFVLDSRFFGLLRKWQVVPPRTHYASPQADRHVTEPVSADASRKPLAKLVEVEEEIRRRREKDR